MACMGLGQLWLYTECVFSVSNSVIIIKYILIAAPVSRNIHNSVSLNVNCMRERDDARLAIHNPARIPAGVAKPKLSLIPDHCYIARSIINS